MAYFDAFTSNLFRRDLDGRRLLIPFRRSAYLVSDVDAKRIESWVKGYYAASLAVIVLVQIAAGWRWNLAVVPAILLCYFGLLTWLIRSLPRVSVTAAELPLVSRAEALQRQAVATGRVTLWVLVILGTLMTAASVYGALRDHSLWFGAVFFGACTSLFVFQLTRLR